MADPSKKLSDFDPELLDALLAMLAESCPAVGFNVNDLPKINSTEFHLEMAKLLGRRSVYEEVRNAIRVSRKPAAVPQEICPAGWDGDTRWPGGA